MLRHPARCQRHDTIHYAVDGDLVVYEEHHGPITPLRDGDPHTSLEHPLNTARPEAHLSLRGPLTLRNGSP